MATQSGQWIATARLLRRTGFGATGAQIDAVARQNWSTYLDTLLNSDPQADPGARATPMPAVPSVPPPPPVDATQEEIGQYSSQAGLDMQELARWWQKRMASVKEPIHEKLTLLWHNHFATSATKVKFSTYMGQQNQKIRELKLGDFRQLAFAMLSDGAMLGWLDGKDNVATSPNENLSREFMELFALGHGNGYTETDVKEGARALTGWFVRLDGSTAVRPDWHDSGDKTVLGTTGDLDAAGFCDAVLSHPNSARYVCTRFWQQLASDNPPSGQTLDGLVTAYGPARDLKALTKAILMDPEFPKGISINTPVEWLVGLIRALSVPINSSEVAYGVDGLLTSLGQRPMYPPDVAGWPRGRVWVSTASTGSQLWAAYELASRGDLSPIEHAAQTDRIDAIGYLLGIGAWSDRSANALKPFADDPRQLFTAAANTPEYLTS